MSACKSAENASGAYQLKRHWRDIVNCCIVGEVDTLERSLELVSLLSVSAKKVSFTIASAIHQVCHVICSQH
jgi:hypothetical protein